VFVDPLFHRRLRQHNSADSIVQLGNRIFEVAARVADAAFTPERRTHIAIVCANALVESFRFREARQLCKRTLGRADVPEYWLCRTRLILAKALRYQNKYEEALTQLREISSSLRKVVGGTSEARLQDEAKAWRARVFTAMAQCQMALGRLGAAERALNQIGRLDLGNSEAAVLVEGLALRHRGTIQLLRGRLYPDRHGDKTAGEYFEEWAEIVQKAPPDQRTRLVSIASFKQARVMLERLREWEGPVTARRLQHGSHPGITNALDGAPSDGVMADWLREATARLVEAKAGFRKRDQGDHKWFPAIELWLAEAHLQERRLRLAPLEPADEGPSLDDVARRVEAASRQSSARSSQARQMEIEMLGRSIAWQRQIEDERALSRDGFVRALMGEFQVGDDDSFAVSDGEIASWSPPSDNPYKRSRADYERMYYLWRALPASRPRVELSNRSGGMPPSREEIIETAARAYRRATSMLYGSGMAASAHALHRLALVAFAGRRVGLQELLEAAACLRRTADVHRVLDTIAIEALERPPAFTSARDEFFVLPTKVICRLLGADAMYRSIAASGELPAALPVVLRERDPAVVQIAKELALDCDRWIARRTDGDWDASCQRARVGVTDQKARRDAVERHVRALAGWLRQFLTIGPAAAARQAITVRRGPPAGV
jgi:hypothetical protein